MKIDTSEHIIVNDVSITEWFCENTGGTTLALPINRTYVYEEANDELLVVPVIIIDDQSLLPDRMTFCGSKYVKLATVLDGYRKKNDEPV